MMNTYRYATRALLTLCFFTVTIISTVSGEVIHFRSNMEYVPNEVSQRDYISDEDLLKVVEDIEQQQSGGGAGRSGEGLTNSIRDLIVGLPDHDNSNRLSNSHTTANVSVEQ